MNTPPPILYKYLDSSGGIKTLENQTLRFSVSTSLNDPFECRYGGLPEWYPEKLSAVLKESHDSEEEWIHVCYDWLGLTKAEAIYARQYLNAGGSIEGIVVEHIKMHSKTLEELHENTLKQLAISSFSESPNNILMWGHYTRNHAGCVIGFNSSDIQGLKKVCYSSERVSMAVTRQDAVRVAKDTVRTKSIDWKYEQEWRLIVPVERLETHNGILVAPFSPNQIQEIILGCRVDPLLDQTARVFARKHSGCKLLKAHIHPNEYRIEIRPYDEQEATP